ncbi:MAG: hypothetical protein ACO39T_07850 [Flavobacteriaceae bacterium]
MALSDRERAKRIAERASSSDLTRKETVQKIKEKTGLSGAAARNIIGRTTASQPAQTTTTTDTFVDYPNEAIDFDPANYLDTLTAELGAFSAGLQNERAISNYGWDTQKTMEELRQAGSTERQKLVNENNLAVTGMEVKGKLDLQGIINAGYKNIANIERGSNMFSSIMGAFNF